MPIVNAVVNFIDAVKDYLLDFQFRRDIICTFLSFICMM